MARVVVEGDELVVSLNPVEALMAMRRAIRLPLTAIRSVRLEEKPLRDDGPLLDVKMGFAASGAPLARVATVGPRLRTEKGRALVVVWLDRRSLVVEADVTDPSGWNLVVLSTRRPDEDLQLIEEARLVSRREVDGGAD